MTTSAEWWTPAAWQARLESGNPMYPYEWAVRYWGREGAPGRLLARLALPLGRTSKDLPLQDIAWLQVTGPVLSVDIPAPPDPIRALVLRATVEAPLAGDDQHRVTRWMFGFETGAGFWGILIDATGRITFERGGSLCDSPPPPP